eukprot:m.106508 g.106508  ORF g.106508 m.106508 type:complete len:653 (-) comp15784_c0_seq1:367-2325(-)
MAMLPWGAPGRWGGAFRFARTLGQSGHVGVPAITLGPAANGTSVADRFTRRRAFQTLTELEETAVSTHASKPLFGVRHGSDGLAWSTYADFGKRVDTFRGILHDKGIKQGDTVGVVSVNRPDWAAAAFATYSLGAIWVPMYEAQTPSEWTYILEDSASKLVWTSTSDVLAKVQPVAEKLEIEALCFDSVPDSHTDGASVDRPAITEKDPATLIYTSGTTGTPKGVVLSHENIVSNVKALANVAADIYGDEEVHLSILPWAHAYGHTVDLHFAISKGSALAISNGPSNILQDFQVVRPTALVAVPKIFYKVHQTIYEKVYPPETAGQEKQKPSLKSKVFEAALRIAEARQDALNKGSVGLLLQLEYAIAKKLVFDAILDKFGGRLKFATTGGARLSKSVQHFFACIGIPVLEGYGLTETSPLAASERYGLTEHLQGGLRAVDGVEIIIATPDNKEVPVGEQGEICVSGPNVMIGYHNLPDVTAAEIVDIGGRRCFKTGDRGVLDEQGVMSITGRVKEIFKLGNGKYVAPGPAERALEFSRYIAQSVIYGDDQDYVVAIVVPEWPAVRAKLGLADEVSPEQAVSDHHQELHDLLLQDAKSQLAEGDIKHYEWPKKLLIIPEEFTIENGLLSQKQSIKRTAVVSKYKDALLALYE